MANVSFRGDAPDVAQVDAFTTGGTYADGRTFSVSCNGKTVSYTSVAGDTITSVASKLAQVLTNTGTGEFSEATWSASPVGGFGVLKATSNTPGRTHVWTAAATGGSSLTLANVTPAAGKNHWDTPGNWSNNAVPATGDNVTVGGTATDITYGLNQSGVNLGSLHFLSDYTGSVGLPAFSQGGYAEFRPRNLAISAANVEIGRGDGQGSQLIRLDLGANPAAVEVFKTAASADPSAPALFLAGSNAANVLTAHAGFVGVAFEAGTTARFDTVTTGYVNSPDTDVTLLMGDGTTHATINHGGGRVETSANVATVNQSAGKFALVGAATVGTLNGSGGSCDYRSTGTATNVNIFAGYSIDCAQDSRARTWTNTRIFKDGGLDDRNKSVTLTNPIKLVGCGLKDVPRLNLGTDIAIARS